MRGADFAAKFNEMSAAIAAEQVKALSRPQNADAYKVELPKEFAPPQGVEFKLDEANPLFAQAKAVALKYGLPQEGFSEFLGLVAGNQVASEQQITTARNAEIAKLGTTGPARIDALSTFYKATLGDADGQRLMSRLFTADDVKMAESLVSKLTNSGASFRSGTGREPPAQPGKVTEDQWKTMSPGERLDYSRSWGQGRAA